MSSERLHRLQMKEVKLLVIDEYSVLSVALIGMLDSQPSQDIPAIPSVV
jgi:hypothetical protein